MFGRRKFLQMLSAAPVAGPAIARQVVQAASAELAGISVSGVGASSAPYGNPIAETTSNAAFNPRTALRKLLDNADLRSEYTSLMFIRHRSVGYLDYDLANKHSFSLAAKIAFQRQRNVAREIESEAADSPPWRAAEDYVRKAMKWPF